MTLTVCPSGVGVGVGGGGGGGGGGHVMGVGSCHGRKSKDCGVGKTVNNESKIAILLGNKKFSICL